MQRTVGCGICGGRLPICEALRCLCRRHVFEGVQRSRQRLPSHLHHRPDSRFALHVLKRKKPTMSRPNLSLRKQLVVASALAFGATSVALGDDSRISPFTDDSHTYFHGGQNLGNFHVARAPRVQAADASAARIKKEGELTPEQKINLV